MQSIKTTTSEQPQHKAVFTVAGAATGGGAVKVFVDGQTATDNPAAAATPTITAAALVVALDAALGAGYTVGAVAGVVTVERDDKAPLVAAASLSTDATQSITTDSKEWGERIVLAQTVKDKPDALAAGDGQNVQPDYAAPTGVTVCVVAALHNPSGGAKTARYRLRVRQKQGPWYNDLTFGTRSLTESTGAAVAYDVIPPLQLFGVEEVQLQLVDDGAAANLVGCTLEGWAHFA